MDLEYLRIYNNTLTLAQLENGGSGGASITLAKITSSDPSVLSFSGYSSALVKLSGLAAPTADSDAVTKMYTDTKYLGVSWKQAVRAATTSNVTLSSVVNAYTLDGVVLTTGDRVLIKNQSTGTQNGVYIVQASGTPTRATGMDTGDDATSAAVFVEMGTTNKDCAFVCTNNRVTAVVGTHALNFSIFATAGEITGGAGLTRSGNELSVNVDNSTLEITGNALNIKNAGLTNAKLASSNLTLTAGNGLGTGGVVTLGNSVTLNVNVDNASIGITSDTLGIKDSVSAGGAGVLTNMVNSLAVTTPKIDDMAVTTPKIDDMAVTAPKMPDLAVITDKIPGLNVTTAKIDNAAVSTGKIVTSAVTTAKILDANVTNAKLANSSLTVSAGTGLGDGGLVSLGGDLLLSVNVDNSSIEIDADAVRIKDLGVTTAKIDNSAVTTAKIDGSAVTNDKLTNPGLSVLAGAGLGGGGSVDLGGSISLSINVDDSSVEINADAIRVKDLGVTTGKINNSAVTTVKLGDAAVTEDKLAASAATTAKINDAAVTEDKLATSAVTTAKILNASVTNAKLANSSLSVTAGAGLGSGGSVSLGGEVSLSVNVDDLSIAISTDALQIKDLGITTAKINNSAVTSVKIADFAVTNNKLENPSFSVLTGNGLSALSAGTFGDDGLVELGGSVTLLVNVDGSSIEIDADAVQVMGLGVTTAKIADAAVTTAKIDNAAVTAAKIASSAVTTAKIEDATVTNEKLADSAVTTAKIPDANVTNAKLANSNLSVTAGAGLGGGGPVSLGEELSLSVNVDDSSIEISADAIQIKDLGVTTAKINNAAVTTAKIDGYAVTNDKLANSSVSVVAGAGLGNGGLVSLGGEVSLSLNVDDSSIEINANAIRIKDGGVATGSLNDGAVTTAKLTDSHVTTAKIADSAVTTTTIFDGGVTNAKLSGSSVTVSAGDGLQSGGAVSLGNSVSLEVDSSVVRTSGAQSVGGAKTFTSGTVVSDATASSSSTTGCLRLGGGLGVAEKIYAGSDMFGVAFIATSDATLKTDIAPISGALQKIAKIDPVEFKFNFVKNDCTHYGVLAQQLEESGLDSMVERGGEHLSVEYNSLTGLLLAAVKDLSAEIYKLESLLI